MAIQVVRRHIQDSGDVAAERSARFQLETRQFQHVPMVGTRVVDNIEDGSADVACKSAGNARVPQDMPDKRCRRGLAISAGDADHAALQGGRSDLQFPTHAHSAATGKGETGKTPGHPWRRHDEVLFQEQAVRMRAEVQANWQLRKRLHCPEQLGAGPQVGGRNDRAPRDQESHGGEPGLAEADDERAFAFQLHRSFNVLIARSAQTNPAIQNRTITFDSGQPICSK